MADCNIIDNVDSSGISLSGSWSVADITDGSNLNPVTGSLVAVVFSLHAQGREEAILFRGTQPLSRQSPLLLKKDCQQTFYFGLAMAYIPLGVSLENKITVRACMARCVGRKGDSLSSQKVRVLFPTR